MNRKSVIILLLLASAILVAVPESFARSQYLTNFTAVYGDGSCGTCHIRPAGGGPRNSYGTLFEEQPNHATDPSAALTAIGPPPALTSNATATPSVTSTKTPPAVATETPAETATPEATVTTETPTATGTQAAPGFGIVVSLVGLFACALLARKHNK